jgi:hypothetical protein
MRVPSLPVEFGVVIHLREPFRVSQAPEGVLPVHPFIVENTYDLHGYRLVVIRRSEQAAFLGWR